MDRCNRRKFFSIMLCISLVFLLCMIYGGIFVDEAGAAVRYSAAAVSVSPELKQDYELENPKIDENGVATWDCVYFGSYWQEDTNGDGSADEKDDRQPIKWRVLSIKKNDAFLLADRCLDYQRYHAQKENVTWETSTLCKWLNEDFYQVAFDGGEQSAIQSVIVSEADESRKGDGTADKIYLLSEAEATNREYGFCEAADTEASTTRWAQATAYANHLGLYATGSGNLGPADKNLSYWWLRTTGNDSAKAMCVTYHGYINKAGFSVNYDGNEFSPGVRPVLHLDLSSSLWTRAPSVISSESDYELLPAPERESSTGSDGQSASDEGSAVSGIVKGNPVLAELLSQIESGQNMAAAVPVSKGEEKTDTEDTSANSGPVETTPSLTKVKGFKAVNKKKGKINLSWKAVKEASGYQIRYSEKKNMKWQIKYNNTKKTTYIIKKRKKKTYYLQVRAFKKTKQGMVFGKWCKIKKLTVKK